MNLVIAEKYNTNTPKTRTANFIRTERLSFQFYSTSKKHKLPNNIMSQCCNNCRLPTISTAYRDIIEWK